MLPHLYRFRPIERLLGDNGELRGQYIFFAEPSTLNDPMEGFSDTVWQGDGIVWGNLFRHYLICLTKACALLAILGEEHPVGWHLIPVEHPNLLGSTPQEAALQAEIVDRFMAEPVITEIVEAFASRKYAVRRNELVAHLRSLSPFALWVIYDAFERNKLLPNTGISPEMLARFRSGLMEAGKVVDGIKRLESQYPDGGDRIDAFFTSHLHMAGQLDFIHRYNGDIDVSKKNKNFVHLEFPEEYVRQTQRLMFPIWYAACFLQDCMDSSTWAHYGEKHTGVCLKFKVSSDRDRPALNLTREVGFSGDKPLIGKAVHHFYEVRYSRKYPVVDFFRSLGRMPIPVLTRYWLVDRNGNRSPIIKEMFDEEQNWRKGYWDNFYAMATTKLEDWRNEKEYRLILSDGDLLNFSNIEARKIKYDFSDLEGLIFGINTPGEAKLEICKTIEDKCRAVGRTDFKFYQAYYARSTGTIEHAEMGLLKFKQ